MANSRTYSRDKKQWAPIANPRAHSPAGTLPQLELVDTKNYQLTTAVTLANVTMMAVAISTKLDYVLMEACKLGG